jgi:uncharacterized protein
MCHSSRYKTIISLRLIVMSGAPTHESVRLRALIEAHHDEFVALLTKYGATNPRLFGSVARGEATADSDIDLMVDMMPSPKDLWSTLCLSADLEEILGTRVDVVCEQLLRTRVTDRAKEDMVPL